MYNNNNIKMQKLLQLLSKTNIFHDFKSDILLYNSYDQLNYLLFAVKMRVLQFDEI